MQFMFHMEIDRANRINHNYLRSKYMCQFNISILFDYYGITVGIDNYTEW